jgi:hypothetical protein
MANKNINYTYPFISSTSDTVVNDFITCMDRLPLFAQCRNTTDISDKYVQYDMNEFNINVLFNPIDILTTSSDSTYNTSVKYTLCDNITYATNTPIARFNKLASGTQHATQGDSAVFYPANFTNIFLYTVGSTSTNGFWTNCFNGIDIYTLKTFITRVIDEDINTASYALIICKNITINNSNNYCWLYTHDGKKTDIKASTVGFSGYSCSYILRQYRIAHYLLPDLYVISGGLAKSNDDVIIIDNNVYVHLCNEIYIKIK